MDELHSVEYGTTIISFSVSYSSRKTLGINVYPDTVVKVVAPVEASMHSIRKRVEKRAPWIQKQIRRFTDIQKPYRIPEYVSGETHNYLGRQYRLRIQEGLPSVKLEGKFFKISLLNKLDKAQVETLLEKWYKEHAHNKLRVRFEKYRYILQRENVKFDSLLIRNMKNRWGSCTEKGKIILNTRLIKTPVDCIDYVIVHEMCHLKYMNHSAKFYKMLTKYVPDWGRRKKRLERYYK